MQGRLPGPVILVRWQEAKGGQARAKRAKGCDYPVKALPAQLPRQPCLGELPIPHHGPLGDAHNLDAFNPLRAAILLVGSDKTSDDCWYETHVPAADRVRKMPLNRSGAVSWKFARISRGSVRVTGLSVKRVYVREFLTHAEHDKEEKWL